MKNQNSVFVIFCLGLTVLLMTAYSIFTGHFNNGKEYQYRIGRLQNQIEKAHFDNDLLVYQLQDFQQSVAQLMPDNRQLQAKTELKNFADTLRAPASENKLDLSGAVFEKAKKFFAEKEYDKAIREFHKLTDEYPLSPYNVESRFFMAESYFIKKDYKASLNLIDEMVSLYPDNDLTGFILLRMGQISEINNQYEEASEIYRTVEKNFKNEKLKTQAKQLAKNLDY